MERPPLEKVIERLEKLDARQWERDCNSFNAQTSGLIIHLHVYKDMGITHGHIELINENDRRTELAYEPKNKEEKRLIVSLYKRVSEKYVEAKNQEFEERVKNFLSE